MLGFIFAGLFATAFKALTKALNAVANASYTIKDLTFQVYHTLSISQYCKNTPILLAIYRIDRPPFALGKPLHHIAEPLLYRGF